MSGNTAAGPDWTSDDDDQAAVAAAVAGWATMANQAAQALEEISHGGSKVGKAQNIPRDFTGSDRRLWNDYFCPSDTLRSDGSGEMGAVYSSSQFETFFKIPRPVFDKLMNTVVAADVYFQQRPNAIGSQGISPRQKVVAALHQLTHGPADQSMDVYYQLSESTLSEALRRFCQAVVKVLGPRYLRYPSPKDFATVSSNFEEYGFPGCFGAISCARWQPSQIKFQGNPGEMALEIIADVDLHIWHCSFGRLDATGRTSYSSVNDQLESILTRNSLGCREYSVGSERFDWRYLLSDAHYPPLKIFVEHIATQDDSVDKLFSTTYKDARDCGQKAKSLFLNRFRVFLSSRHTGSKPESRRSLLMCSVAIHNMIVEMRGTGVLSQRHHQRSFRNPGFQDGAPLMGNVDSDSSLQNDQERSRLLTALKQNVWETFNV